ncbi:MAG TPA: CaiB/BaiF CoA-transferase family protein [Acidimicrobiales bacterium]|nr:CaiB/BaiF CoA-transferase family protein [Acidimicrobiales bacterium]
MGGPLHGFKVVELAGIGPGPFAGMLLCDMGADVLRVDRSDAVGGEAGHERFDVLGRGRRSVAVDLKHPQGPEVVLRLVEQADALLEGFRPGVTERLGIGPDDCMARNPRLVYGRMTGWGQEGPLAQAAGRDVNYVALSGTLAMIGRAGEPPVPPLTLLGDFGGGGMLLAFGMVCAMLESSRSGRGQVVDAAMLDGAALLAAMFHGMRASGEWTDERGANLLDTGAWFYEVYETSDERYISLGPLDERSLTLMLELTGLADDVDGLGAVPRRDDRAAWPAMKQRVAALVRTRTRDEWCRLLEGTDACFAPVLGPGEAPDHPHARARGTFVEVDGVVQAAPAPRFGRTPPGAPSPPPAAGQHTGEALVAWGFDPADVEALERAGALRQG